MKLIVIAKSPVPGRVKTRLCPPCTPDQAAAIAEAALADTLEAVRTAAVSVGEGRPILALEGAPGPWLPPGYRITPQRGRGLDERLAAAFEDAGGAAVLVGMDTPQVRAPLLQDAVSVLAEPGVDAVLGDAADGGFWIVGLRSPDPAVFMGVPMSSAATARAQRRRLRSLGLRLGDLPVLRDVDTFEDACAVAGDRAEPASFPAVVGEVRAALAQVSA